MELSYLAVTTTRYQYIDNNIFVSFDKEGKEWCQFMRLAPELVQHAINHCSNKENVY